jgi:WD40 repeat protein
MRVTAVAFSPDGRYVVSGSEDGTAWVWEVTSGHEVARLTHDDRVFAVAFSPDGHYVVSGSWDGTARVWEAASGHEVARLTHGDRVFDRRIQPRRALCGQRELGWHGAGVGGGDRARSRPSDPR